MLCHEPQGASRRIGFVPMTAGGSSLFQDWAAPWSAQHGLSAILVMLAKQAMQSAGEGARLAGMIWVQVRTVWVQRVGRAVVIHIQDVGCR